MDDGHCGRACSSGQRLCARGSGCLVLLRLSLVNVPKHRILCWGGLIRAGLASAAFTTARTLLGCIPGSAKPPLPSVPVSVQEELVELEWAWEQGLIEPYRLAPELVCAQVGLGGCSGTNAYVLHI